MSYPHKTNQRPRVFAHRGASEEFPENTILSFDMAVRQGAVGIETDLQYTKDYQIVCFHDQLLDHLSTMKGSVRTTTLKELAKAKVKHNPNASQSIPTLIELLEWLPKATSLILELKDPRFGELERLDSFINILAKYNVIQRTILASFSISKLKQVKKVIPSVFTCFITLYNLSPNIDTDVVSPFYPILWLNPTYSDKVHKTNKLVSVWDPHPEYRIESYLRRQVDIVTGDNPSAILRAITIASPENPVSK